jgi:hypothetical protein
MRSISETRLNVVVIRLDESGAEAGRGVGLANPIRQDAIFGQFRRRRKKISKCLCLQKKQSNLHTRNHVPILILPRILNAPDESCKVIRLGLSRRRGHVFDGNSA